jgi:hypothetical protein
MNTLPVSAIILAHQSNLRLHTAIQSVQWAAEILVIWTDPDTIPKIEGNHHQLKILTAPEAVQDFAHIRNMALREAMYEWIFFLDSDEVFDEKCLPELQSVIENPLVNGAKIFRRDIFLQKEMRYGEVRNVSIVRLMRQPKAKYERAVHEVAAVQGHIAQTNIIVYHFAHSSVSDFLSKVVRYIQLEKIERNKTHQKFSFWEMIIFPLAKFFQNFILRGGFLDGWRGLIYATMMSVHSYGVRAVLYEQQYEKNT